MRSQKCLTFMGMLKRKAEHVLEKLEKSEQSKDEYNKR